MTPETIIYLCVGIYLAGVIIFSLVAGWRGEDHENMIGAVLFWPAVLVLMIPISVTVGLMWFGDEMGARWQERRKPRK
jgi:hypothetical protein